MTEYSLSFSSFSDHASEVIYRVLRLPLVSEIIFPAYYYTDTGETRLLESVDQIRLEDILDEIEDELSWILLLEGVNGLILKMSIHKLSGKELVFPHMLSIRFNDLHFNSTHELDLDIIKSLFEEFISVFKPYTGGLYQNSISTKLRKDGLLHMFSMSNNGKPHTFELGWISYCGPEQLYFAGRQRFQNLTNCLESYSLGDGMMLILQEEPYVDANHEHRQRFESLINELRFQELRL